jgi:DNA-binding NarL/FixJ family response regulator
MTRVLIVDDHEVVREGLQVALSSMSEVDVVGTAGNGAEALQVAKRTAPEIAVVDLRLPDMPGDELCVQLRRVFPSVQVVIFTTYLSEDIARRAFKAGAARFVAKSSGLSELRDAIGSIIRGEPVASGGGEAVVNALRARVSEQAPLVLTPRQTRVLELAADGLTYQEIAARLYISESTVRFHMQTLKAKLGARTKTELITKAIRSALIDPSGERLDDRG